MQVSPSIHLRHPEKFRGMMSTASERFEPLLVEARRQLVAIEVPSEMRECYAFGVLAHDQPSFVLLPLMFLALAEQHGGVTAKHRAYLPWLMLSLELIAIADDAIDGASTRSERATFVERFGMLKLVPFTQFLTAKVVEGVAQAVPEEVPRLTRMLAVHFGLQSCELNLRYPAPSLPVLERALSIHYDQAVVQTRHAIDVALALNHRAAFPEPVVALLGELMQDVDDLVNLVEQREYQGESDDLKLGTVTYPLLATLRADSTFADALQEMWQPFRQAAITERSALLACLSDCSPATQARFARVRSAMFKHGVPATLAKLDRDVDRCRRETPAEFRDYVSELCDAFWKRAQPAMLGDLRAAV